MFGIGIKEILIVLVIGLIVFGGYKKLPEIGNAMGKAIKNFKKGITEPEEIDVTPQASDKKKKDAGNDA